ncbi:MAG: CRISPR-associated endonuclease Cas2 [Lachnospiraceae bacterium]|nr:CRISPR-associated endonuclease Cas2 [Lachnospiraceae bacterium]
MIVVSYDISDDKLRTRFSKYLTKYGHRMQYSVFEIDNSERVLKNIVCDIRNKFEKKFCEADSVIIFVLSGACQIYKYGYAKNEDRDLVVLK